jgi:hypothetical protein
MQVFSCPLSYRIPHEEHINPIKTRSSYNNKDLRAYLPLQFGGHGGISEAKGYCQNVTPCPVQDACVMVTAE